MILLQRLIYCVRTALDRSNSNSELGTQLNIALQAEAISKFRTIFDHPLSSLVKVWYVYTGLFELVVGVLTTCHTSRSPGATPSDFFLWGYVKDQVYVPPLPASIPELKVVTCYKQFGMNLIIVLMFVESHRVHI